MPSFKKLSQPLYNGSAINADTSWCTVMHCAVKNKLPYSALESIIDLIQVHCPKPNMFPTSLYKLKTHFNYVLHGCTYLKYCDNCMAEVDGVCPNAACTRVKAKISYYALLPIKERLKEIFVTTRCKTTCMLHSICTCTSYTMYTVLSVPCIQLYI